MKHNTPLNVSIDIIATVCRLYDISKDDIIKITEQVRNIYDGMDADTEEAWEKTREKIDKIQKPL